MNNIKKIVNKLIKRDLTISTMESCTGGSLVNEITNIEGASSILKFSAVTYSNEYKIKMGVSSFIISKYGVYSIETAREMAINIANFANSDIGVGITGKLNKVDEENKNGLDNQVFISIYYKNKLFDYDVIVPKDTRENNKKLIVSEVFKKLEDIIDEKD